MALQKVILYCLIREDTMSDQYDFIIVGSGAGGATLAKELSGKNKKVLIIERGRSKDKIGTFRDSPGFYDSYPLSKMPLRSKEGTILYRTLMRGGSTIVSCGNGVRCLQKELFDLGIDLEKEFLEAEEEMHIHPYQENLLSKGSKEILRVSRDLGFKYGTHPQIY